MLLVHCMRRAASRAACTAGSKSAISTAMIAITTRSSISVNPRRERCMAAPPGINIAKSAVGPDTKILSARRVRFPGRRQ